MENRLQRQPGPFQKINFQLQLQACLRPRINIALQLQSAPLQEFNLQFLLPAWYVHCVSISLDDANDATLVPDQKSDEAEELTESAPQTQEQSHRCGPQRLSCIAGGEC